MKKFMEYLLLLEGPGAPPSDPGAGGGAPLPGNLPGGGPPPLMGGGPPPLMGGGPPPGLGGGMPGMGGPMGGPAPTAGPQPLPVRPKDVWKAIELALGEMETSPVPPNSDLGAGSQPENLVQNNSSEKRHLMGVPGF